MSSVPVFLRVCAIVALAVSAGGCAGRQSHELTNVAFAAEAQVAAEHRIFVATTREPADDPGEVFGRDRAETVTFARVDVSVPPVHETGKIESPPGRAPRDPAKHFAAREIGVYPDTGSFSSGLSQALAAADGRAMVFVHGYNTLFDEAVYRAAQIVHDASYKGVPVLFSWASAGRVVDYIYDSNSATIGRDGLERTLRLLASSGATRIDIVAHSMGNWVAMEALRQLAITGDRDIGGRLGDVVLASPDIDIDVFASQLQRIGRPDRAFFVLHSGDDRALQVSSLIAGNRPRVGYGRDVDRLAALGVIVVDVTNLAAGDGLNHTKFADNPLLVRLLGERLREDDALGNNERDVADRITRLAGGLGQTVGSAAEIIITTPAEVLSVVTQQ